VDDAEHHALYGSELAQDAAYSSHLYDKAEAIAAYMSKQDQKYRQDLRAIWANNGKGLLVGYPGAKPEIIQPEMADYYKVKEARFQVANAACTAGKRLGEIRMSFIRQEIIQTDGNTDDCVPTCKVGSIAVLRLKIDNLCQDCGSQVDKGFHLRVTHWNSAPSVVGGTAAVGEVKLFEHKFEFTGRKPLACDSTGTFDVILSALDTTKASKKDRLWPENVKIEVVSPCRESLAYMSMTQLNAGEKLVAPSWLSVFGR
jgi:hypothetical protein